MKTLNLKTARTIAISLSSKGFGFAVVENEDLLDWGVKSVPRLADAGVASKVSSLIQRYSPTTLILPDYSEGPRRSIRVQKANEQLRKQAEMLKVKVSLVGPGKVKEYFFPGSKGTNHDVAVLLAARFPDELADRLPPKRKPWMSEDARMSLFNAVALVYTHCETATRWTEIR